MLLIVPGDTRVDLKAAAQALKAQNVRLIPFNQAERISGYPPGGTPSIGHKTKMRTVVDESVLTFDTVYCGGGSRDKMLEIKTADVVRLNNAIVAKIASK